MYCRKKYGELKTEGTEFLDRTVEGVINDSTKSRNERGPAYHLAISSSGSTYPPTRWVDLFAPCVIEQNEEAGWI